MRQIITCILMIMLTFTLVINEASAKRFGGGRSFGVQRSYGSLFSGNKAQNTATLGQRAKSRWGGVLGGMLVGGLLASLFMGHGLANGLMTWLILGSVIFFIVSYMRRKMQPGFQSAHNNAFRQNNANPFNQNYTSHNSGAPAGFSSESFLRNAKVSFIRLQAAYDQKNIEDLNQFTAPEVFAEIKMQLEERGNEPNKTEVINLNAELLDVSKQAFSTMASVRFTGSVIENGDTSSLDEIWHFRQSGTSKEWLVSGVQQEVHQA